jgi:hypothetical protein
MAHPANTTAQDIASTRRFNMYVLPHLAHWPASYTRTRPASLRDPIDNRSSAQAVLRSAFLTARLAVRRREVSSSLQLLTKLLESLAEPILGERKHLMFFLGRVMNHGSPQFLDLLHNLVRLHAHALSFGNKGVDFLVLGLGLIYQALPRRAHL